MDSRVLITISVCGGEQVIKLSSDSEAVKGSLKMTCAESDNSSSYTVYLNKDEVLLLKDQLNKVIT